MTASFQSSRIPGMTLVRAISPQACVMAKEFPGHAFRLRSGGERRGGAYEHTDIVSGADLGQAVQESSVCSYDSS